MPLVSEVGRRYFRVKILILAIIAFLWLGVALHLFPVWWMFITSIKPAREIFMFPPALWPEHPTFIAYKLILRGLPWGLAQKPIYVYVKNSIIMTGGIIIIQVPLTALLAYSLSKLASPGWSRILFLFCIGPIMISGQLSLIPSYLIMRHFPIPTMNIPKIPFTNIPFPTVNLLSTYWAVILPASYNAFNILLFKGFFDGIPDELINAARLDGASEFSIWRRIILPFSKPVVAVVTYFAFTSAWNNFMWPLIVIQKPDKLPLSVYIYKFQLGIQMLYAGSDQERRLIEQGITWSGLMAISILESIPVFIMFLVFREYLMKGIKLRGFK